MENGRTGWDIFFIILACVLVLSFAVVMIIPLTQGLNPFKLMAGNVSEYNFIEQAKYRETNILEGLLGITDPSVYPMTLNEQDKFEYVDGNEKKPFFKSCNEYEVLVEAYNKPQWSDSCMEVYGPYGIEFKCGSVELSDSQNAMLTSVKEKYPDALILPYYAAENDGKTYISAVDLASSVLALEYFDGTEYKAIATVSGDTWARILESNNGIAVLRNPDGTLIFGGGKYRFTILLKQVLIDNADGEAALKVKSPKMASYDLNVNDHECSNGVLIANNAAENMDIQLNVINDESTVCYAPESKINLGKKLKIGISLSEERCRKLLGSSSARSDLKASLDVYRYDSESGVYVLIDTREVMDPYSVFLNETFVFEGEAYRTGKYKIVMNYDSKLEHIEQEYEYYLVFES